MPVVSSINGQRWLQWAAVGCYQERSLQCVFFAALVYPPPPHTINRKGEFLDFGNTNRPYNPNFFRPSALRAHQILAASGGQIPQFWNPSRPSAGSTIFTPPPSCPDYPEENKTHWSSPWTLSQEPSTKRRRARSRALSVSSEVDYKNSGFEPPKFSASARNLIFLVFRVRHILKLWFSRGKKRSMPPIPQDELWNAVKGAPISFLETMQGEYTMKLRALEKQLEESLFIHVMDAVIRFGIHVSPQNSSLFCQSSAEFGWALWTSSNILRLLQCEWNSRLRLLELYTN